MYNTAQDLYVNHLHGANGVTEKIKKAMYESAKQFVYIGFLLREVKEYGYYKEGDYADVYAYAEFELGFKRSSTKNFIAIAENFGTNEYTYGGKLHREPTMHLQPKYEKFNYSQLVELLAMSEKQRQAAKPDMTVKQLRELKKAPIIEQVTMEEVEQKPAGQTSGQKSLPKEPTPEEIEAENERLYDLYGTEANIVNINGEDVQISHYIMEELCRLAGIKYIDYEDYTIAIDLTDNLHN